MKRNYIIVLSVLLIIALTSFTLVGCSSSNSTSQTDYDEEFDDEDDIDKSEPPLSSGEIETLVKDVLSEKIRDHITYDDWNRDIDGESSTFTISSEGWDDDEYYVRGTVHLCDLYGDPVSVRVGETDNDTTEFAVYIDAYGDANMESSYVGSMGDWTY